MKLPKEIKNQIRHLVNYNERIKEIMREITEWNPKLDKPIMALREGWTWDMYFSGTPNLISEKEIEAIILTALTGNVHKVNYGGKTITLKELRQNET